MKNTQLMKLIEELKNSSRENQVNLWRRIANDLEKPTSRHRIVNLSKISKYAKDDEVVVVPGKVLSMGDLDKKITIAAYKYSQNAVEKIQSSGSTAMSLRDLLKKNPKGQNVRILG